MIDLLWRCHAPMEMCWWIGKRWCKLRGYHTTVTDHGYRYCDSCGLPPECIPTRKPAR